MIKIVDLPSFSHALNESLKMLKEKENNEIINFVVKEQSKVFFQTFLLENLNKKASFGFKVSSFNNLITKTLESENFEEISEFEQKLLILRILKENDKKFNVLKSDNYSLSYANEVLEIIKSFKYAKLDNKKLENFKSQNLQLQNKIKDLNFVLTEYENNKFSLDDADKICLATKLLKENNKKFIFIGFDDFENVEYEFIVNLAKNNDVTIFNYLTKTSNSYIFTSQIFNKFKKLAFENDVEFLIENYKFKEENFKTFLEENLFGIDSKKFVLNEDCLNLACLKNIDEEIEYTSRKIREKILNGERFKNFGVACFGLENFKDKFEEKFKKYEINFSFNSNKTLKETSLYKFFLSIFKFNLEENKIIHLIDIINSPFYFSEFNNKKIIIEKLNSIKNLEKFLKNTDFSDNLALEIKNLEIFLNLINFKNKNIFEIKNIFSLLDEKLNFDKTNNTIYLNSNNESMKYLLQSKEKFFEALDIVSVVYPEICAESLYDIFLHFIGDLSLDSNKEVLDSVKIFDAENIYEKFDELFILNCSSDVAPKVKNDCGILLDSEIQELGFENDLKLVALQNKMQVVKLFNNVLMFNKKLNISYSSVPSSLFKELTSRIQVETELGLIDFVVSTDLPTKKYKALTQDDFIEESVKNFEYQNLNVIKPKKFEKIKPNNLSIFENMNVISASQLENYFDCPFYYFLNNVLKIQPKLENKILALDIGNILHEILFRYYTNKKQVDDVFEFCKSVVLEFVNLNDRLKNDLNNPILKNLIDEAVRVINGVDYIDKYSLFKPKYFEYPFKNLNSLKLRNIEIEGKVDRVDEFENLIRIVDYKSGKANATLKELYYGIKLQLFLYSCAMEENLKKHTVGTFYLPLHNAYTRENENPYSLKGFFENEEDNIKAFDSRLVPDQKSDIVNVRMNSKNLARRTLGNKELSPNEFAALKNYSKLVSEQAVDEIKSGYIKPSPSAESKPCDFCPYSHICFKNASNIKFRQDNKVDLTSFKGGEDE